MVKKMLMTVLSMVVFGLVMTSCDGEKPSGGKVINPTDGIPSVINEDMTLKEGETYTLSNKVEVKNGASLTIPAGVTIKAKKGFNQYILVEQGGKIFINGTAAKPVRMTAEASVASAGYWGGLVINGFAPITNGGTNKTEIDPSKPYGGNNIADNSGVIRYLILEYTGAKDSADTEHNGLTLNGVGNGTIIENIYVPSGSDDGIEFFGGSVDVKNILVVNADDDMFDFTEGYCGTVTNAYGIWEEGHISTEKDPRGVEADGNHDGLSPEGKPQSNFKINGMTIDLKMVPSTEKGYAMNDVIKVRRGALANITNTLVKGTGVTGTIINMTDGKGDGNANTYIELNNQLVDKTATPLKGTANVKENSNLKGVDKAIFAWTGYNKF